MFCQKCGSELPDGAKICVACGFERSEQSGGQYQTPPNYAYQAPKKRELKKTEKLFVSAFKEMSWVTLTVFILGCAATFFSFISIFVDATLYGFASGVVSGLKSTAVWALLTVLATLAVARLDSEEK